MKLYESKAAPNGRRVRIYLHEKRVENIEIVQIDVQKGENLSAEFRIKNPLGKIPVLELDDGTCISESVAICRYFEELDLTNPLMGADPLQKAVVEQWQRWLEFYLFMPTGMCFQHTSGYFKDRMTPIPQWGEQCGENVIKFLQFMDKRLANSPYLAGKEFSIADITALVAIDFNRVNNIKIADEQVNLKRWYADVSSRPSAAA